MRLVSKYDHRCLIVYMEIYIVDPGVLAAHSSFRQIDDVTKTRVEDGQAFGDDTGRVK